MSEITLNVNGVEHTIDAESRMPLLWALRDLLGFTGTKYGCGIGQCGSCTVMIDGRSVKSCQRSVSSIGDGQITTIEGLSENGDHPLQLMWDELNVAQCGYCQAGQIMNAAALLLRNPDPDDAEIDAWQKSNLCRCGTYVRIREAIKQASNLVED